MKNVPLYRAKLEKRLSERKLKENDLPSILESLRARARSVKGS